MNQPLLFSRLRQNLKSEGPKRIFIFISFLLLALPFWNIVVDLLTRSVINLSWYRQIENFIVPYELRVVGTVLQFLQFPIRFGVDYFQWIDANGKEQFVSLAWNCVGWQTFILFIISLVIGLSTKYRLSSKIETMIVGLCGTYLVNIFRLTLVVIVYYWQGSTVGRLFHIYSSSIISLLWLFGFWWFSLFYILELPPDSKNH